MSDEKIETWLNWLAVTTVIFSACATLSTFRGSSFSTRAIIAQTNAADQWAFYQAKSVKQHTCELTRDQFKLSLMAVKDSSIAAAYRAELNALTADIARYQTEKEQAMADAKGFESSRADFQSHGAQFAMGVVYLQVAIVFSALSALMKRKPVWLIGVASGTVGLIYFWTGIFWKIVH